MSAGAAPGEGWPRRVVDGIGREVQLAAPPRRIVSLVPSTTETLAELGLGERVVGRTRFCVHPAPWVQSVPAVGGTKDPDPEAIAALRPDLVLANQEENLPSLFPELAALAPLAVAYPRGVDEARDDLRRTARLTGSERAAAPWLARIDAARASLRPAPFTFACLVWRRPWMAAGDDTYLSALMGELGGRNVLAGRYPELTLDELVAADPDTVLLPSEPYPFAERHLEHLEPLRDRCRFVDGELLTWHGTRMALALESFAAEPHRWRPG